MLLAFGEIMARIAPPGQLRWRQALPGAINVTWGGGEANVCASLAMFGQQARYLTALPRTPIAEAIVACDLNFRKKLWSWRPGTPSKTLARECMAQVLPFVDLVIANEEDAADVLDIHAAGTDVTTGRINAAAYTQVARQIVDRFPNVSLVAITLRDSLSADHNNWGGMLYEAASGRSHFAPLNARAEYEPYEIRDIVDRVGSGDSFAAGL